MKPLLVYIAGPLTSGDARKNCFRAMEAALQVFERGHLPICPHSDAWLDKYAVFHGRPVEYDAWMARDLALVARADALLRIGGESPGADREVALAREMRIPVYRSIEELPIIG